MSVALEAVHLTPRETEVLRWVVDGKTVDEIAVILDISYITVNTHKLTMMRKAGVYKDTALVTWAFRHKIVE